MQSAWLQQPAGALWAQKSQLRSKRSSTLDPKDLLRKCCWLEAYWPGSVVADTPVHLLAVSAGLAAANPGHLLLLGYSFGGLRFHCSPFSQGILLNSVIILIIQVLIDRGSSSSLCLRLLCTYVCNILLIPSMF